MARRKPTSTPTRQSSPSGGLVYSTEHGAMCPRCGRPKPKCACKSSRPGAPPGDGIVRVWLLSAGRKGKGVSQITGLALPADELAELASRLKKLCGSGGTLKNGVIEIQGDHRDVIIEALRSQGHRVKKAGG